MPISEMLPELCDSRDYRWAHLESNKLLHTKIKGDEFEGCRRPWNRLLHTEPPIKNCAPTSSSDHIPLLSQYVAVLPQQLTKTNADR